MDKPVKPLRLLERPSGRAVVFTLLYFSEGAPIGFVWLALPTLLRAKELPVEKSASIVALLVLPWVFKFLWAPLVDGWRGPRWGFRSWIISAQLLMGLSLLPLVWIDPARHLSLWLGLLLVHAFAAATQDVAIDALAINTVPTEQRGLINGCMQMGMLLGRSLFGGGALLIAAQWAASWVLLALVGLIWSVLALLLFVHEPTDFSSRPAGFAAMRPAIIHALRTRATWVGLAFALVAAAAFEATGVLAGPFLLDRGVSQKTIGFFLGGPAIAGMLIGGLIGGKMSDRLGRYRSVGIFLAGFCAFVMALGVADRTGAASPALVLALLGGMYLFIGLYTAASYAMYMDLTNPKLGGTQFSAFMAATNGCESWATWMGGRIAAGPGYGISFLVMGAISLSALVVLRCLALARGKARPASVSGI